MPRTEELLRSAAAGKLGVDRRLIRSILEANDPAAVLHFSREPHDQEPIDLQPLLIDLFRHFNSSESLEFYLDEVRREPLDVPDELVQGLIPFARQAVDPLIALYEELGEEQGSDIAFLLAGLRIRDPRVLALLTERLEFDAADGAFCLGLYGDSAARPALERMRDEIPEEDLDLRQEFARALEMLDAPEPQYDPTPFDIYAEYPERVLPEFDVLTVEERKEFTHDEDAGIRGGAWASLAEEIEEDDDLRRRMLAVLRDPNAPVEERSGAAVGLQGLADQPEVRQVVEELYKMGGKPRARALETMWRSMYPQYRDYFPPHLEDASLSIRRHAIMGAGYFKLAAHLDKITAAFEDSDLRDDALFAYALAMPGETSRGRVKGMLRKIDSIAHLNDHEMQLVMFALDQRLELAGLKPVFTEEDDLE